MKCQGCARAEESAKDRDASCPAHGVTGRIRTLSLLCGVWEAGSYEGVCWGMRDSRRMQVQCSELLCHLSLLCER